MGIYAHLAEPRHVAARVVLVLGSALLWRGLRGDRNGARGLLRPQAGSLGRAEGWRLVVLGLTAVGLGLAGLLAARWLLFLSLAFGFVETLEATTVIAAWRAGDRRAIAHSSPPPTVDRRSRCRAAPPIGATAPLTQGAVAPAHSA